MENFYNLSAQQLRNSSRLEEMISLRINLQSLEDTQVGYISHKYTLAKYTLEKNILEN